MNRRVLLHQSLLAALSGFAASAERPARARSQTVEELRDAAAKLRPLHAKKRPAQPRDWLSEHAESGQTFDEYRQGRQRVCDRFRTTYVQPLGAFTGRRQATLAATTECLGHFFGLPVRTLPTVALDRLPAEARRVHPKANIPQVLSTHLLNEILAPRRPSDAVAVLGLTTEDLWPGAGWNYVFGQASLTERVGVWSLHRNGDPDASDDAFREFLLRSLKTALHETGHMLGIPHCIAYECCMNGSNHREESDRKPLEFCPECQPKIWWTCDVSPRARTAALLRFAEQQGLTEQADHWRRTRDALEPSP